MAKKPESPEATPRKRTPTKYVVQHRIESSSDSEWLDDGDTYGSIEEAEKSVTDRGEEGTYRIVTVRRTFRLETQTAIVKNIL